MIGAHLRRNADPETLDKIAQLNGNQLSRSAVQIFVHNPRSGHFLREPLPEGVRDSKARIYVHSPYVDRLRDDPESARNCARRAAQAASVGAFGYVLHLYSEPLPLVLRFLERFFRELDTHKDAGRLLLFLEATVVSERRMGEGRYIDPKTMAGLLRRTARRPWSRRLALCLDTAHMWSCGWDPTSARALAAYLRLLRPWLSRPLLVHLNDSKQALGEDNRDRHAPLGDNMWTHDKLRAFLALCRRHRWDCVVETGARLSDSLQFIAESL